jgi:hypothetical protein
MDKVFNGSPFVEFQIGETINLHSMDMAFNGGPFVRSVLGSVVPPDLGHIKSINGVSWANIKSYNGVNQANIKSAMGVEG